MKARGQYYRAGIYTVNTLCFERDNDEGYLLKKISESVHEPTEDEYVSEDLDNSTPEKRHYLLELI